MLGTDTLIEGIDQHGVVTRMAGYERGETLNAIFRATPGTEFIDKHIVSGADTKGYTFDIKVVEGLLILLKALSEGKFDFKIIAHSRGAVETLIIVNKLQEIIDFAKSGKMTAENFKDELLKIILKKTDSSNTDITAVELPKNSPKTKKKDAVQAPAEDQNVLKFKTSQTKTTNPKKDVEQFHNIDLNKLFSALKQPDQIKAELFLMDPVPGQKGAGSWLVDKFFKIPAVVKKAEIIYMRDERTAYFEPILPDLENLSEGTEVIITPLPGHHGTASGFLDNQGSAGKDVIASDKDDEHGLRGKKTRHVQKLIIQKLVTFLNLRPSANPAPKVKAKRDKVPSIEKTIESCRIRNQFVEQINKYFIKRYEKMIAESEAFNELRNHTYYGLKFISGAKRSILTSVKKTLIIDEVPALHVPPGGFVNNENIRLIIKGLDKKGLQDPNNASYQFICEQLTFFATCFNEPEKQHEDKKGNKHSNNVVIDYFCKHKQEIHRASGYFSLLLEPYLSGTLNILLDPSTAAVHGRLASECANVKKLMEQLFVSLDAYSKKPKVKHTDHAKELHSALITMRNNIFGNLKESIENTIVSLETALKEINGSDKGTITERIKAAITNRESLLTLLRQLEHVKQADLINQETYDQLCQRLKLTLDHSLQSIVALTRQARLDQNQVISDFSTAATGLLSQKPDGKYLSLITRLREIQQGINESDINADGYEALVAECNKLKETLASIQQTEQQRVIETSTSLSESAQLASKKIEEFKIDSFDNLDKDCVSVSQEYQKYHSAIPGMLSRQHDEMVEKLNIDHHKKLEDFTEVKSKIELIEKLCKDRQTAIKRLEASDSASQRLTRAEAIEERMRSQAERLRDREELNRALAERVQAQEEQAKKLDKEAKEQLAQANREKTGAEALAKEAEKQTEQAQQEKARAAASVKQIQQKLAQAQEEKAKVDELLKQEHKKLEEAEKNISRAKRKASELAKLKKDLQQSKEEAAAKQKIIDEEQAKEVAATFDEQYKRLQQNIDKDDHSTEELKLMSTIASECAAIASTDNSTTKQKLAHTLKIVNDFVEENNVAKKNHALLAAEAKQYRNSKRKSFQLLGGCMLALGILSIAALITVSVLTFGVGLLPMTLALAAIYATAFAAVGVGSAATSGYSMFAAKQPKMQRALRQCAASARP